MLEPHDIRIHNQWDQRQGDADIAALACMVAALPTITAYVRPISENTTDQYTRLDFTHFSVAFHTVLPTSQINLRPSSSARRRH